MKTRIILCLSLLLATSAFGANVLIRNLTPTIVLPAANTYLMVDGATQGTGNFLMAQLPQIVTTRTALAGLSVTSIPTNVTVQTLGGAAVADGNASLYYYNSSSTATPNGTTVIQPTVGSGRWLICSTSAIPAATASTLGGVFSKAGVSHQYLSALDTAGNFTLSTVTASDVSGFGTMALQNASAVAITGGTLTGMTSYSGGTGAFTTVNATGGITNLGATIQTYLGNNGVLGQIGTQSNHTLSILVNNAQSGLFTSTGLNATPIGVTTPAVGNFTTSTWSSNANIRTTKAGLHLTQVNVQDYGAVGNGSTDNTAAINAAIAALTSNSSLYFPPGKYRFTGALSEFSSLSMITVWGEGAELYNDTGAAGGNTFVFHATCSNVKVSGLRFTGTSTVRGSGIHIRMYCSQAEVSDCYFQGCSDFAIHFSNDAGSWSSNMLAANNIIVGTLGDGIHFGNVIQGQAIGNIISFTGDDALAAVADDPNHVPNRISFIGNHVQYAGNSGTHGAGLRIDEAIDVLAEGNDFFNTAEAGIMVGRYLSTTAYNARISLVGNKIFNAVSGGIGPRGAIWVSFCQQLNILNNQVIDTLNGASIALLDIDDAVIKDNFLRKSPFRGIVFDDATTTNVAASWTQIYITGNDFDWVQANEAIYLVPPSTVTVTNLMVTGNTAQIVAGNWIFYNRINTGRIFNNTNSSGATVAAGGTVTGVTAGNNN